MASDRNDFGGGPSAPLVGGWRRRRLVAKDGSCTLRAPGSLGRLPRLGLLHLQDLWGALMALRWRWVLLAFCASFLAYWLLFACLWYLLAHANGDLSVDHDDPPAGHVVCVLHVDSFTAAFSFSLETQLTIGYGTMYPSGDCPWAIAMLAVQMLLGLMLEAVVTGAFVAKIARPKRRVGAVQFSHCAVVDQREGEDACLMIRAASLLRRPLVDVRVTAVLYKDHKDQALHQTTVEFHLDHLSRSHCPLFLFPLTFYHSLDHQSPLYPALREADPVHFELVLFLTAIEEGTGDSCQARTSYLREEIRLDHHFASVLDVDARGLYVVNMGNFGHALPGPAPTKKEWCSVPIATG